MSGKTTGKRGKKTAVGKKELQLSISKDTVNTKNRKTFDDNDEDNDEADDGDDDGMGKAAAVPAKKDRNGRVIRGKKTESKVEVADDNNDDDDEDDDAPEVVQSGADDIKRLRKLHEQMMLPTAKKAKKRRRAEEAVGDNDEELDASILAAVDEADVNDMTDEEEDKLVKEKINKEARKSRKIGHIEVAVLGQKESIIGAFGMPKSAQEFAATREGRQPRTKFGSFRSQKKLAPSKSFSSRK